MAQTVDFRRMRFLITGVTGFVGPYLAGLLLTFGHDVYGLCRVLPKVKVPNMKYIIGDLTKIDATSSAILRGFNFDGVFHLAGLTHPPTSFKDPGAYFETNALGTVNLCNVFAGTDTVFMQCSTPEVYGLCPEVDIMEGFPMTPMNPYGVSKAAADLYILERTGNGALHAFITRAGSHTGAGRPACYSISSDAVQIARIKKGHQAPVIRVGNMSSQRAVIDVRDVVLAYGQLMELHINNESMNGGVYHISGHDVHSMDWYLNLMLDITKVKAEKVVDENLVRKIDIPIQILNSDRTRSLINWEPRVPIEDTLKGLLNYWMEKI